MVVQTAEKCGLKAEELEVIAPVLRNALSMVGNYGASLFCSPGVFDEPESAIDQMANMLHSGSMPMPFLKFLLAAAHENDEDAFNRVRNGLYISYTSISFFQCLSSPHLYWVVLTLLLFCPS